MNTPFPDNIFELSLEKLSFIPNREIQRLPDVNSCES
jgi:hypothetical protein